MVYHRGTEATSHGDRRYRRSTQFLDVDYMSPHSVRDAAPHMDILGTENTLYRLAAWHWHLVVDYTRRRFKV